MMGLSATTALAPTFAWTSAGTDLTITIGGTPYAVTVPTIAATRFLLAGSATEFMAHVVSAINTAVAASGRTFTLTMLPSGRLRLAIDSGKFTLSTSLAFNRLMGFFGTGIYQHVDADSPPWYFAMFGSVSGGVWAPMQSGGFEVTAGGGVYGFAGTRTAYRRDLTCEFIPWDEAVRSARGDEVSSMWPDLAYIGDLAGTGVTRPWSVLDVLQAARNVDCGLALGNFQAVRTSTTEPFYVCRVAPGSLLSPEITRQNDRWPVYVGHKLGVVLPTSGYSDDRT